MYQEHHFNPTTKKEAYEDGVQAYRASKSFAERAVWDLVQVKKPGSISQYWSTSPMA
jgi:hypothetical protein